MTERTIQIVNPTGLHARPASDLSKLCKTFKSDIKIINEEAVINPKSIFSLLEGELRPGLSILIRVSGEDEKTAIDEICNFIETLKE